MDIKNPELIVQLDQARLPIELRLAESLKRDYAFPYSAGLFSPERPEISLRRPSGLYDDTVRPLTIRQGTAANKFQIIPGYVNMEMPTLATVALDNDPPPEITVSADTWVWIKVIGSFGTGTGGADEYTVTIETTSTSTPPSGTAITASGFTSFRSIGMIDFTAGSPATYEITNYHNGGNLGVDSFGNVNLWWLA